ncbi:MAG: translocation/assembly module TamB domain-containing protein, partial [Chitinophagaceae bacterium]
QLYLTSNLHIGGTKAKPVIDGAVTVNDGTNLTVVIPQREPGVVEREGVIQFVNMSAPENDSLFLAAYDSLNTSNLIGFDIATNIEIRKEAILNLIIDEANGDFVNVQGEAQLTAGIDPSGKVSMIGSYEIERGAYEISFNFLRRRFEIEKGSKIVWMGEPTGAELDVTAIYIANTSPLDLVEQQIGASPAALKNTYLQKLPFEVHLNLAGQLLKPEISFDIILPTDQNYNVGSDVVPVVQARLSQLRQEPGEINKQVFSLLLLNRFVGENPFQSSGEGFSASSFARQSVSKLLTEQLNSLASGLIQGVDLNFDVISSDDYTTGERRSRTDLNVGVSKRLLNDRLTVTVGSNFGLEGPQNTNQKSNNFAGDISVNYQLSKDGRYMLRAYRVNEYEALIEGHVIETGISFIISVDYDHFREVLRGKKAKVETVNTPEKTNK